MYQLPWALRPVHLEQKKKKEASVDMIPRPTGECCLWKSFVEIINYESPDGEDFQAYAWYQGPSRRAAVREVLSRAVHRKVDGVLDLVGYPAGTSMDAIDLLVRLEVKAPRYSWGSASAVCRVFDYPECSHPDKTSRTAVRCLLMAIDKEAKRLNIKVTKVSLEKEPELHP